METSIDPTALLSRDDLAARYQIPKATLAQWAHKGYGPQGFRVGRHIRYYLADVLAWERKQRENAA